MVAKQELIDIMNESRRAQGLPNLTDAELVLLQSVLEEGSADIEVDDDDPWEAPVAYTVTPSGSGVAALAADADEPGWSIPGLTDGTTAPRVPPASPQQPPQRREPQGPQQPTAQQPGQQQRPSSAPVAQRPPAPASAPIPDDDDGALPEPHPAFRSHFTAAFYTDQADEFAPFGNDEAADSVAELIAVRRRIVETTTLRALCAVAFGDEAKSVFENLQYDDDHVDPIIIGVGFLLILLTGRIDDEGRRALIASVERADARYGEHTANYRTMLADLRSLKA